MRTRLAVCVVGAAALLFLAPPAQARRHGLATQDSHDAGMAPAVSVAAEAHVPKGEVHQGDLVAIMGDVQVEGTVSGQIVVIMGSLELSGTAEGDVVSIMSRTKIHDTAEIGGQLVNIGGSLSRDAGSRVAGEIVDINFFRFIPFAGMAGGWSALLRLILIIKLIMLAALFLILLLVTALIPRRLSVMADAFPRRWGWALLVGLGAYTAVVIGCVVLAITLIGIPLAIALGFAMFVTKCVGLASILFLVGHTAGRNLFGRDLPHLASVLGGFFVYALLSLVPFFGSAFRLTINLLAVGIVLLTRFGAEPAPPRGAQPALSAAPVPSPPAAGPPDAPPAAAPPAATPPGASPPI